MNLDIHKKVKSKQLSSLYLLYGKESYFIDELTQLIISTTLNDEERDFNLSTYDMEEVSIDLAIEDAQTLPFFGDKRIVIVKNAWFLTGTKDKEKVDHTISLFESYIQSPSPFTIFIVVVNAEKLDDRKKISKLLKKEAEVFEASIPDEKAMVQWLKNQAKEKNVSITDEAILLLLQYVRNSVTLCIQELNKMATYVGEAGSIDIETVRLLSSKTIEDNIFELVDCVTQGKVPEAMVIFQDLLKLNEEPIKILSLLAGQFRLLFQVKELSSKGYGQQQIASHLKIHPFRVKLAMQKVSQFSADSLLKAIHELAEMDYKIKTGQIDKKLAIELFILKQ
ncbi:DNA polymerase III subunit delta [Bacillus suaedaesalsae]|uniref:DNA polymerase III subunit delta n=1 Tax=Bacillus suaedaesalsae TaxID=2810349 RepID=A0ABS2DL59_9BACI|nr:DNA polymerase III subunit delta [Bacillus suaedaesalsae]MBM6619234.1 DNA polymerase III subunit delta [Bacillus suaedaesalsae]